MNPKFYWLMLIAFSAINGWWVHREFKPRWADYQAGFKKIEIMETSRKIESLEKEIREFKKKRQKRRGKEAERDLSLNRMNLERLKRKRPAINQIVLDGFSYVDRCTTCHLGIDKAGYNDLKQPFAPHPAPEIFRDHNFEKMGCTPCHRGLGRGTMLPHAHGHYGDWGEPIHIGSNAQSSCRGCHDGNYNIVGYGGLLAKGAEIVRDRGCAGCHKINVAGFREHEVYKIGPSLRKVFAKHQDGYTVPWVQDPREMSPTTRMPIYYFDKLQAKAIVEFLKSVSEPYPLQTLDFDIGAQALIAEGERVFNGVGCRGCHAVDKSVRPLAQNLGYSGSKLRPEWIYDWIREPKRYDPNTRMPNLSELNDAEARAVTAYLSSRKDRRVEQRKTKMNDLSSDDIDEIVYRVFRRNFVTKTKEKRTKARRRPYTHEETLTLIESEKSGTKKRITRMGAGEKMKIVLEEGRRQVLNYGCFGCHDIPTFETESQIGVEITEFALKPPLRLSFGDMTRFRRDRAVMNPGQGDGSEYHKRIAEGQRRLLKNECDDRELLKSKLESNDTCFDEDSTSSWVYHKLKMPRVWETYDASTDDTKRLRMPDMGFTYEEAKAVRVFVMSLNGGHLDRGSVKKSYKFNPDTAWAQGRILVQKYNCRGCHVIEGKGGLISRYYDNASLSPPNLTGEGSKVQSDWLFGFLKKPFTLRPWLKLRMPTFGFDDATATTLVSFFAQQDGRVGSYVYIEADPESAGRGEERFGQFECVKCHQFGGKQVEGLETADLAPDLTLARRRLRPDWIVNWLKNPQAIQPETRMPNFFYDERGEAMYDHSEQMMNDVANYLLTYERETEGGL